MNTTESRREFEERFNHLDLRTLPQYKEPRYADGYTEVAFEAWQAAREWQPSEQSSLLVKDLFGVAAGKTYGDVLHIDYGRVLAWLDMAYAMDVELKEPSEIICHKCGLREERGEKPECDF